MKILMDVDARTGPWSYVVELARALECRDVQVDLAVFGALPTQRRAALSVLGNVTVFECESVGSRLADVDRAGERLIALETCLRPDVVHVNDFIHGTLPFRSPVLAVTHSCALSRWTSTDAPTLTSEREELRKRVRQGLRAADLVVAPTEAMFAALDGHFGALNHGCVIAHGIRPRAAGKRKQTFVLCAGGSDAPQCVEVLAQAAQQVSWPMFVTGERTSRHERFGDDANLHPVGDLDSLALERWYSSASIYCLPARCEPFGLTALEAAMRGCALVLGDIQSLREVWGDSAVYHSPDDPDALARTVQQLIDAPLERQLLGSAARIRSFDFGADRMAQRYAEVYAALGSGGHVCQARQRERAAAFAAQAE